MSQKEPKPLSQNLKESALRALWLVAIVFVVYLLQGCGKKRLASVEERQTNDSRATLNDDNDYSAVDERVSAYKVRAGDTLYSIAFRFGLDYRTLAKANDIGSSYLINVGQTLNIDAARNYQAPNPRLLVQTKPQTKPLNKPITTPSVAKPSSKPKPNSSKPSTSKPIASQQKPKPVSVSPKPSSNNKPATSQTSRMVDSNNPVKFWIWPNMGKVTKGFIATGRKGIDISGNIGDSVRASAAGRVVYAGRGLRGYGNLVIIKHNNSFISAYAHNRRILVKENEIIKAGQKIAEIGNSDTDLPKLHFEIRYKGKPTDPLKYLPKR